MFVIDIRQNVRVPYNAGNIAEFFSVRHRSNCSRMFFTSLPSSFSGFKLSTTSNLVL